jgi:hypothetical protein
VVRPVVQAVLQVEQPVVRQEERPVVLLVARQAEQRVAQQERLEVRPQPVVPRRQVARQELLPVPLAQSLERSVLQVRLRRVSWQQLRL